MIRRLTAGDRDSLHEYLVGLSDETKKRFGPHSFDKESISELLTEPEKYSGYIVQDSETGKIVAYSIVKTGFLEHDRPRLESYGLRPDKYTDATFAPSVADEWQGLGVGIHLFHFMVSVLRTSGVKRIILWGGVQSDNLKAVKFYRKLGFTILGQFEYYGQNYDMIKDYSPDHPVY